MEYSEFLENKVVKVPESGFSIEENELNPMLFDFQKHIVKIALKNGRYAIFADTGLGKTIMQLEYANQVVKKTGGAVLIFAPLGVNLQTINEAKKFNIEISRFNGCYDSGIYISNYEQIDNIDCSKFIGIVLDESGILKSYTGVYRNKLTDRFKKTPYKLCCTATPSPNDINEIGQHSEFLNVLDSADMRAKWFVREDGMNNYRLKGHATDSFYSWVSSWASMISNPKDIGFEETGKKYILPKLLYTTHEITSSKKDDGMLFNNTSVNAISFNRELKRTIVERTNKTIELLKQNSNNFTIVWVNQNAEADYLVKEMRRNGFEKGIDFEEVRGSEKTEVKENKLLGFAAKKFNILITKKKMAQFGLNYQHCNTQIFMSLDFSFEGLYQAVRRSYRFGQSEQVNIHLLTLDTMQNVIKSINEKERKFNELKRNLNKNTNNKKYGLIMDYDRIVEKTENYEIVNGDSCVEMKTMESNSIDFSVFSPPFSTLFTYSNSIRDLGNCENESEFFKQNEYILKELFRVIKPGRLVAIHTKDLPVYKGSSGYTGLNDFTGSYHRAMEKAGFKYHSKITIWTDPVLEMQRTKTQRLLYKQLRKDSTFSGVGLPEYITIFKKWEGIDSYDGIPVNNKNFENFNLDRWQSWASPIWGQNLSKENMQIIIDMANEKINGNFEELEKIRPEWLLNSWFDIKRTDVLTAREASEKKDEKHICPLQLSVIKRCVQMWTNPGEIVFSPFMGIGSEGYEALKLGRKFKGIELKPSYFEVAKRNLTYVDTIKQAQLF